MSASYSADPLLLKLSKNPRSYLFSFIYALPPPSTQRQYVPCWYGFNCLVPYTVSKQMVLNLDSVQQLQPLPRSNRSPCWALAISECKHPTHFIKKENQLRACRGEIDKSEVRRYLDVWNQNYSLLAWKMTELWLFSVFDLRGWGQRSKFRSDLVRGHLYVLPFKISGP